MKKVLVACEESQAVTSELRKLGFDAYSCDIIDSSGGHPEWHIMQNVLALINGNCTFKTTDGETHTVNGKWYIAYITNDQRINVPISATLIKEMYGCLEEKLKEQ